MIDDDDEIKAEANRLRQSGWANRPEPSLLDPRHKRRKPAPASPGSVSIEGKIAEIARWLADEQEGSWWPTYVEIIREFRLTYDEAVLAVIEAKRLVEDDDDDA